LTEYAKVIRKDAGLTAITIPSAPSDLKATVIGARYVKLRWRDNSNSETGFRIERKAGTGKYTLIRIVGANTTVSLDKNLTRGKVYYYRVSAKNRTGKSAYSNVAAVRIPY
jgi:fibronectin type 3 domain-containing protein